MSLASCALMLLCASSPTSATSPRVFFSFNAAAIATRMKSRISQTVSIDAPSNRPRNPPTYINSEKDSDQMDTSTFLQFDHINNTVSNLNEPAKNTYLTEETKEFKCGLLVYVFNCQVFVVNIQIQKILSERMSYSTSMN